jgi:hypothetical protein
VGHEALIRYWPRLRGWLDEDRADLRVFTSVRLAVQQWQQNQTDEGLLIHHEARLIDAERLVSQSRLKLNQEEVAYLRACRNRQDRQAQRERRYQRRIVQVSLAGAVITTGLAVLALYLRSEAEGERIAAVAAKTETQITFAKELFRPLGLRPGGLNLAEISALHTLGSFRETQEQVRVYFIKEALSKPENARRFADRVPAAMQAVVGLNRALGVKVADVLRAPA